MPSGRDPGSWLLHESRVKDCGVLERSAYFDNKCKALQARSQVGTLKYSVGVLNISKPAASHAERNQCPVYTAIRVIEGRWKPMIFSRLGGACSISRVPRTQGSESTNRQRSPEIYFQLSSKNPECTISWLSKAIKA